MNPPDIVRRAAREALSYLPAAGLCWEPPPDRPEGISVFIRVRNAEDWIEASIRSVLDFADEILVAENGSTDGTPGILGRLASECGKIRIMSWPEKDYLDLTVSAAAECRFRWTVRWDADFVAHTSGRYDIRKLRERLLGLGRDRFYVVYLRPVNLFGDLEHVYGRGFLWCDCAYTASSAAGYLSAGGVERLSLPKYYAVRSFTEPYFFHANVKPLREMLLRHFWNDWLRLSPSHFGPVPETYVLERIRADWGARTLAEGGEAFLREIVFPNISRYDPSRYGAYPELLEKLRLDGRYRVTYSGERPSSRTEQGGERR